MAKHRILLAIILGVGFYLIPIACDKNTKGEGSESAQGSNSEALNSPSVESFIPVVFVNENGPIRHDALNIIAYRKEGDSFVAYENPDRNSHYIFRASRVDDYSYILYFPVKQAQPGDIPNSSLYIAIDGGIKNRLTVRYDKEALPSIIVKELAVNEGDVITDFTSAIPFIISKGGKIELAKQLKD
ncbi:MAG: hypothetical protein CSA97_05720 [Bacteroidetes bacterium]|nr:MAG: hypothetical protein CSA97_05720 [Bacteroidota bacterium]